MRKLHVLVTMDVEPVKQRSIWTGPEDKESSERFITAYRDISVGYGFMPSFFVHPEAAQIHADLLLEYRKQGATLGLHVHPTKFHFPDYQYEFGGYSGEKQREIVQSAAEEWEKALGFRPRFFRPGAFSANDASASVLSALGFIGGSLSIPGRVWPERYCVWAGTPPYPHRTHQAFRCAAGSMDFVDIPLSVDFDRPAASSAFFCYEDLRPSGRKSSPKELLIDMIVRMEREKPDVPVIHLVTHNDQPYDDPGNESRRRLEETLQLLPSISADYGFELVSASIEDIAASVLSLPVETPETWEQDNEVYF